MQINEVAYKWVGQLARRTATRRIILHHAAAVKRFQASRGIAADGLVGRDTWHKLLGA